ncbi:MAG: hypothetical protein GF308_08180 [Candidatus Heimdallarchaeota archaeon]|nr:hypothetical protein [Candidatus Heimdallarchaeota archaeon]
MSEKEKLKRCYPPFILVFLKVFFGICFIGGITIWALKDPLIRELMIWWFLVALVIGISGFLIYSSLSSILKYFKGNKLIKKYQREKQIDSLIKILEDRRPSDDYYAYLQWKAILAIEEMNVKEASPVLINLVQLSTDKNVKTLAILALGNMQIEEAVPALLNELKDKFLEKRMQKELVWALGNIGKKAEIAIPEIIWVLETSPNWKLRKIAKKALEKIGRELGYEKIEKLVEDYKTKRREIKRVSSGHTSQLKIAEVLPKEASEIKEKTASMRAMIDKQLDSKEKKQLEIEFKSLEELIFALIQKDVERMYKEKRADSGKLKEYLGMLRYEGWWKRNLVNIINIVLTFITAVLAAILTYFATIGGNGG